jgi:hypothetical protein
MLFSFHPGTVPLVANRAQRVVPDAHVPGGKSYRVPPHLNAKEIQIVAYLAWLDDQLRGRMSTSTM